MTHPFGWSVWKCTTHLCLGWDDRNRGEKTLRNRLGQFHLTAVISILGLTLALLAPNSASAQLAAGSLAVAPDRYVGGQLLTFRGNIGADGKRKIHLEAHLGRDGDDWERLPGSAAWTDASGAFDFTYRAPSMFNIQYRAASGRLATDPMNFKALSQDLTVDVAGGETPVAGRPFTLEVDTTPFLARRPDTQGLPVFEGRELTLQVRGADGLWQNTGHTARVGADGMGYFHGVTAAAGTTVYRVRQENWFQDGDRIGWMPSFPTFVQVAAGRAAARAAETDPTSRQRTGATTATTTTRSTAARTENSDVATPTAAEVFGWRPSLWDFAWVAGESLTSPPYRGKQRTGWWLDASTGTGRAAKHNGGLELDSQRANVDNDADCLRQHEAWECTSWGTTSVTLQDSARPYGRWETRVRLNSTDNTQKDFRTLLQLVPAGDPDCAGKTITMADIAPHSPSMKFGVNAMQAKRKWAKARKVGNINNEAMTVAVEVTKDHISWFLNGKVIGTVKGKAGRQAVPDVPLTMRLSQQGRGEGVELNRTQSVFDWMRGFDLDRGKKVTGGQRLNSRKYLRGC